MCFYHDGYADFVTVTYPVLRKPRQCGECFRMIPAGELSMHVSQKFEGEFFSDYYCGECEATRFRIRLRELAEGCRGSSTWCPYGDVASYCHEIEMKRSTFEGGQVYFRKRRREDKARRSRVSKKQQHIDN